MPEEFSGLTLLNYLRRNNIDIITISTVTTMEKRISFAKDISFKLKRRQG
jgi:hypothetical protein